MYYFGALLALSFSSFDLSESLSCLPCELQEPCQEPFCCDSGSYSGDICGCCQTCAKGENEECGGAWRSHGHCAEGLQCLRVCGCRTKTTKQCIFPFKYRGKWYSKCTAEHSVNGAPWCATQVDTAGEAFARAECMQPCNGLRWAKCDEWFLVHNTVGRCVKTRHADHLLQILKKDNVTAHLDDPSKGLTKAERCFPRASKKRCRCAKKTEQREDRRAGGCLKNLSHFHRELGGKGMGYCFLEHIQDYTNPRKSCYEDTKWSVTHGRFYSYEACMPPTPPNPFTFKFH